MRAGDILSYAEMCSFEKRSLQHGMNYRGNDSVFLMSRRPNAPYRDMLDASGTVLVYEGHDARSDLAKSPRTSDQPSVLPSGRPTPNGLFVQAATDCHDGNMPPLQIRVYEKLRDGIWVFNGTFDLVKAWTESDGTRRVFKFELHLRDQEADRPFVVATVSEHTRVIPTEVKLAVYKRDGGKCVKCGSKEHLHFDHDLPFSKGGASITEKNVQLLCLRHNLEKSATIR